MCGRKIIYSDGYNVFEFYQPNNTYCPVCEKQFKTDDTYMKHLSSKYHKGNVNDLFE